MAVVSLPVEAKASPNAPRRLQSSMVRNRLILDTDGGVDDAQALLLLIAAGRAPDAITTVFGNVDLEAATCNVLATLTIAGAGIPVHRGAGDPLAAERIDARHVHGDDGLAGAPRPAQIAEPEIGRASCRERV